ncbi:MAG: DUF488 domain-containing protein [Vicinamibacterales bacterium]
MEDFVERLRSAQIERLVDVRKIPRSAFNPQFNTDTLPASLVESAISYEHVDALGGRRGKARGVPSDVNAFWTHESFHNYADYALSLAFRTALTHLIETGRQQRCAIMCSEAVWWRCHRRIIADYLLAWGEAVFHIMGPDRLEPARLTDGANVQPDRTIVYPAEQRSLFQE